MSGSASFQRAKKVLIGGAGLGGVVREAAGAGQTQVRQDNNLSEAEGTH